MTSGSPIAGNVGATGKEEEKGSLPSHALSGVGSRRHPDVPGGGCDWVVPKICRLGAVPFHLSLGWATPGASPEKEGQCSSEPGGTGRAPAGPWGDYAESDSSAAQQHPRCQPPARRPAPRGACQAQSPAVEAKSPREMAGRGVHLRPPPEAKGLGPAAPSPLRVAGRAEGWAGVREHTTVLSQSAPPLRLALPH